MQHIGSEFIAYLALTSDSQNSQRTFIFSAVLTFLPFVTAYRSLRLNVKTNLFEGKNNRFDLSSLLQLLQDREIQLPTVYEMEWYGPENAWVGCCKDLPEPEIAVIRQSVKKAGGRRKQ